jgi:hypothetical protein
MRHPRLQNVGGICSKVVILLLPQKKKKKGKTNKEWRGWRARSSREKGDGA